MSKSFLGIGFILFIIASKCLAQQAFQAYPEIDHRGSTLSVSIDCTTATANQAGFSADLQYNIDNLSNPRIMPGLYGSGLFINGYDVEPGVYRFTIKTSPIADLIPFGCKPTTPGKAELAVITFDCTNTNAFTMDSIKLVGAEAALHIKNGEVCRDMVEDILTEIKNSATDWMLYK